MKLNKQKIDDIKEKVKNIHEKISNSNKVKVPKKYYALLILMIMLGMITLFTNVQKYRNSKQEQFKEYTIQEKQAASNEVDSMGYITAESSISTVISAQETDEVIETISTNNTGYKFPIEGDIIKEFAIKKLVYSETLGMWKTHPGIDIKAQLGEKVKSASNGTVQLIETDSFYGNTIRILDEQGYIFIYSNLDNNINVKEGDKVKRGEIIASVGVSAAGELADSSHLHFEIKKDEIQINPLDLIN